MRRYSEVESVEGPFISAEAVTGFRPTARHGSRVNNNNKQSRSHVNQCSCQLGADEIDGSTAWYFVVDDSLVGIFIFFCPLVTDDETAPLHR